MIWLLMRCTENVMAVDEVVLQPVQPALLWG